MLLFRLILFVGMFLGITYGVEFLMPPFGQLYYTNPLDILLSLSQTLTFRLGVSKNLSLGLTILVIGLLPLFITVILGRATRKKKKNFKYTFK